MNYVQLVNATIQESGSDLNLFMEDGSDFDAYAATDMKSRFKMWVKRAWTTIQQEAFDWEWMSSQAIVNLKPGLDFYADGTLGEQDHISLALPVNDSTDTLLETITVSRLLRHKELATAAFTRRRENSLDIETPTPIDYSFTAGKDYIQLPTQDFDITLEAQAGSLDVTGTSPAIGDVISYISVQQVPFSGTAKNIKPFKTIVGTVKSVSASKIVFTTIAGAGNVLPFIAALTGSRASVYVSFAVFDTDGITWKGACSAELKSTTDQVVLYSTGVGVSDIMPSNPTLPMSVYGIGVHINDRVPLFPNYNQLVITGHSTLNGTYYCSGALSKWRTNTNENSAVFTVLQPDTAKMLKELATTPTAPYNLTFNNVYGSVPGGLARDPDGGLMLSLEEQERTAIFPIMTVINRIGNTFSGLVFPSQPAAADKGYLHSWRSYSWPREIDSDDFITKDQITTVRQVNQQSFRLITETGDQPLTFIPWEKFRDTMNSLKDKPGTPRYVTEDNTGRWRFYPALNNNMTFGFDYVRSPQSLAEHLASPIGLADEYHELVMWQALQYYGAYDEQPGIVNRALNSYKRMMYRLEMQYRGKFHFAPKRLY